MRDLHPPAVPLPRLRLGEPSLRDFRVGVGDARDDPGPRPHRQAEQRAPHHEAGMIAGEMGELHAADRVADGVDAAVRHRTKVAADDDAGAGHLDPAGPGVEAVEIGAAPGCDEEMAPGYLRAVGEADHDVIAGPKDAEKTSRESEPGKDFIFVRADRKNHRVMLSEILYVESIKDYIKIHTPEKKLIAKQTLGSFESELPAKDFLRIHRSYIVNLNRITAYTAHDIEINSIELPIGISYKQKVFEKLG